MSEKISILIPNQDQTGYLKDCVLSILQKTTYPNYEIIIIENGSQDPATFEFYKVINIHSNITVLTYTKPFNFAAINNFATKKAKGKYLLFLNNDTKIINKNWLDEMYETIKSEEDIGVVGATLLYGNEKIQHIGVTLHPHYVAFHHNHNAPRSLINEKYDGATEVDAVTGACLLTKKSTFNFVNGFDEKLPLSYNDVDYCLKVKEKGYKIMWTPDALLYHYESRTRGYEDTPEKKEILLKASNYMRRKWKTITEK